MQFDDRLSVIAEKTLTDGSGKKLNLSKDWRAETDYSRDGKGQVIIYSYWNGKEKPAAKYMKPQAWKEASLEEQAKFPVPCFEREVQTNIPNTFVRTRSNNFYLQVYGLSTSDEGRLLSSRYKTVVDLLHSIRPEVIDYRPKGGDARSFYESSRNVIKRNFRLFEYEYDILVLDKGLGAKLQEELSDSCQRNFDGTLYLKGFDSKFNRQGDLSIKLYDHGLKHGPEPGYWKLELTLRKKTFEKLGLNIADMTFQESCIEKLRGEVMRETLKLKGGEAVKEFQYRFFQEDNVLARVIRLEATTGRHDEELMEIRRQLKELQKQSK